MSKWVTILMLRICCKILSLVILVLGYLKLACYNVIVHKTLAIVSWCRSVSVNIFVSYTQKFSVTEPTQRGRRTSKP